MGSFFGQLLALSLALLNTSYLHAEIPARPAPAAKLSYARHAASLARLQLRLPDLTVRATAFYVGGGFVITTGHAFSPAEGGEPGPQDPAAIELSFGEASARRIAPVESVLVARYDGTPIHDYAILRLRPGLWPAEESAFRLAEESAPGAFSPLLLGFAGGTTFRSIVGRERGHEAWNGKLVSFATPEHIEAGLSGAPILNRLSGLVVGVNTAAVETAEGRSVGAVGTAAPFLAREIRSLCARALTPET